MENVFVGNIVAEGTEAPIFVWLGNRARPYQEGRTVDHVGRIRGVVISDVVIRDAGAMGCSVMGMPGHPVEDITLSRISIQHKGGVGETALPADDKEKEYPEATMFGNLPSKGFFIRHARQVKYDGVTVTTTQPDARPEFVSVDVE